jgi:hypothetical protein
MPRRSSLVVFTIEANDSFKTAVSVPSPTEVSLEEFVHEGNNGSLESSIRKLGL